MENNSDSDWESSEEDQYNDSDTSAEISDPNISAERLYQEVDKLPERLEKSHFQVILEIVSLRIEMIYS